MTDVIEAIEGLRTEAPAGILPAVLLTTGVADGYTAVTGPTSPLFVAFNERGVSSVRFGDDAAAFERAFSAEFGRPAVPAEMPVRMARQVERALATGRPGRLRFDFSGLSEFQAAVLAKTAQILPGEVRPYSWVAREIGRPGAVRAVGTALGRNPVPVLIPCHRVVRADGAIGNYAYGTRVKWGLLEAEGADPDGIEERARRGIRYTGSDTTNIFCNPTCRDARRTADAHRVEFHSEAEARAAGYRPCKHCRPAAAA